jgi:hypothetical protein
MRILKINGSRVELSEKTAIGINYQSSDISTIDKKRFNTTNTFQIPITAHNKQIFEFLENPNAMTDIPYEEVTVNLWDGGIHLIIDGKGYVQKSDSVYYLKVIKDGTIIDLLKETKLRDLLRDNFQDLGAGYASWGAMLTDIQVNNVNGYCIPYWAFEWNVFQNVSWMKLLDGGFGIFLTNVFEMIETLTGYSLVNAGTLTDDSVFQKMVMPLYDVVPFKPYGANYNLFLFNSGTIPTYFQSAMIDSNYDYYGGKTVMDFLKAVSVMFNCIMDFDYINDEISLYKFNDIAAGVVNDWSGKVIKATKKYELGKYAENNYIEWNKKDTLVSEDAGTFIITSNNINLKENATNKIDLMIPNSGVSYTNPWYSIGSLSAGGPFTWYAEYMKPEPLKNMLFFVLDAATIQAYNMAIKTQTTATFGLAFETSLRYYNTVFPYDFESEYSALETMLTDPVGYDAELDLTLLDIHNFKPYELYKIDELGGTFYVNKITGYNSLSRKGTKVELFKIS